MSMMIDRYTIRKALRDPIGDTIRVLEKNRPDKISPSFRDWFKSSLYAQYLGDILSSHKEQIILALNGAYRDIETIFSLHRDTPEFKHLEKKFIYDNRGLPLIEMVKIPEGHFLMGSSDKDSMADMDEKPQQSSWLDEYWISLTPITNEMWFKFIKDSEYTPTRKKADYCMVSGRPVYDAPPRESYLQHWRGDSPPDEIKDHPVVNVNLLDIQEFCKYYKLTLPTEHQWEKAARGVDGRLWPWGNLAPDRENGNFYHYINNTTPVLSYPKGISPFGLFDCAGNVWELTSVLQVLGNKDQYAVVLRGGDYAAGFEQIRCASRQAIWLREHEYIDTIGFRPVQNISR
jgi:formylglycine-generating enzyme required for sulfatase activity